MWTNNRHITALVLYITSDATGSESLLTVDQNRMPTFQHYIGIPSYTTAYAL